MERFERQMDQVLFQLDRLRDLVEPIAEVFNAVRLFAALVLGFMGIFAGYLAVMWVFYPEYFGYASKTKDPQGPPDASAPAPDRPELP